MKTLAILLSCASLSWAKECPKGSSPDPVVPSVCKEGGGQSVQPSDELPPTDKMPSWQREGVHVSTDVENQMQKDIDADKAAEAARLEGIQNCIKKFGKKACPDPTGGKKP